MKRNIIVIMSTLISFVGDKTLGVIREYKLEKLNFGGLIIGREMSL